MRIVRAATIAWLSMTWVAGVAQESLMDSGYRELVLHRSSESSSDFSGRIRYITGASFTLVADTPEENMQVKAGRVEFAYPDEASTAFSKIVMTENVEIEHPQGRVTSARAEFDFDRGVAEFTGEPVMYNERFPEGFFGSTITLDMDQQLLNVRDGWAPKVLLTVEGDGAGRYLLTGDSVADWPGLIATLRTQQAAEASTPGKHIASLIDPSLQRALMTLTEDAIERQTVQIVRMLNGLLSRRDFYRKEAWEGIELTPAVAQLLDGGVEDLRKDRLVWTNRMLLAAAYPGLVAPPPALAD